MFHHSLVLWWHGHKKEAKKNLFGEVIVTVFEMINQLS